jgi:hypothetical protein
MTLDIPSREWVDQGIFILHSGFEFFASIVQLRVRLIALFML